MIPDFYDVVLRKIKNFLFNQAKVILSFVIARKPVANAKIVQYWKLLSVNLERTNLASCIPAKQSLGVVFSGKTIESVT